MSATTTLMADGAHAMWTPAEAAEYLGRSVRTLAKWRSLNQYPDLPYLKYGRTVLYKPEDVKAWFARHVSPRTATKPQDCTRNQSH